MKSVSTPRKAPRPSQRRKGEAVPTGTEVSGPDLYEVFSAEGKALRPWDELPASQQIRWDAVAASLRG